MPLKKLTLILTLVVAAGCSSSSDESAMLMTPDLDAANRNRQAKAEYLAYEHTIVVDADEESLAASFQAVVDACSADQEHGCTVLDSDFTRGQAPNARIRLRIKPEGLDNIIEVATQSGTVIRRNTHVEDLAKAITDIDRRMAMLTSKRAKLLELEQKAVDDIDSLIKITSELAQVQADLEQLLGQSQYQRQRVDMDIVNIQYVVQKGRTFWRPIAQSISSFGGNLADGISDTISAIAYLLPWSIVFVFVGYIVRILWRRIRGRSSRRVD